MRYFPKSFLRNALSVSMLVGISVHPSPAQPGCTDPQAINYDPAATENDGSCSYPLTTYAPNLVAVLPASLTECSGLAFFEDRLWTHLDGGNPDQIYELDTATASLKLTLTIPNTANTDWEDLAEDAEHLYIGDFGNNFGNRTDLRIYKIKKSNLLNGTASPEVIEFHYSDQTDFTPASNNNNYDCEAFFFWNDSLHLFSKNWVDFKTRHYVLPAVPGEQVAELRDSLDAQGQITAADISPDGTALLLGYNKSTSEAFLWLLFDFQQNRFFSGNKRRISLGSAIAVSQVEGLVFRDEKRGYICSEMFSILPPKLMAFDVSAWTENPVAAGESFGAAPFSISPNPAEYVLKLVWNTAIGPECRIEVFDTQGKKWLASAGILQSAGTTMEVDVSGLPSGHYFLSVLGDKGRRTKVFQKK